MDFIFFAQHLTYFCTKAGLLRRFDYQRPHKMTMGIRNVRRVAHGALLG